LGPRGIDLKPGVGRGRGDQVDDDLVGDQQLAAPVVGDEEAHLLLDSSRFISLSASLYDLDLDLTSHRVQTLVGTPHQDCVLLTGGCLAVTILVVVRSAARWVTFVITVICAFCFDL
jgi:hypothetical protein